MAAIHHWRRFPAAALTVCWRHLLIACLISIHPAIAKESYSFAVVPQFEQRKLFATWKPIVDALQQRTGLKLNLVATLSIGDFERELSRGKFDFVYANPYHIVREGSRQGYIPLVRDPSPLRGILVVRKDSPITSPAELDGAEMAIPSYNALGASLLLRADLEQLFKVRIVPVNVMTHSSVYLEVANGLLPAGGGVEKTLHEQAPAVQQLLRVLYTTREMPSHPISAHPSVPIKVRLAVQNALLEMSRDPAGKRLLQHVPMSDIIPTSLADYAPMRKWGLEKYWVD